MEDTIDYSKGKFRYRWRHIYSGQTGIGIVLAVDRMEFLEMLDHWNKVIKGWNYTEAS